MCVFFCTVGIVNPLIAIVGMWYLKPNWMRVSFSLTAVWVMIISVYVAISMMLLSFSKMFRDTQKLSGQMFTDDQIEGIEIEMAFSIISLCIAIDVLLLFKSYYSKV